MVWLRWLAANVPEDIIGTEAIQVIAQLNSHDIFTNPLYRSPLNFFGWSTRFRDRFEVSRISGDIETYLNNWYGDWRELYKVVTKDADDAQDS